MSKYTNAIQRLKVESWIKYWLSKRQKSSYELSEILTGTEFYLQDSAPKKFKKFIPIGRTTQESDPTPENPVPIKNTGDNGFVNEKIENKNFLTNLEASVNTTVTNGIVSQISADTRTNLAWKLQTYNGTTKVEELPLITKNTTGIFSRTFTKNSTFNRIRFGVNGAQRDTLVISDVSDLADGEYTLSYNITNVTQGSISWQDVMITKVTETDLSYVPHSEQNISFPLAQGQKLYEGSYPGDDEKVHHKMKEVVFDGSDDEGWADYGSSQRFYASLADFTGPDNNIKPNILCDKLKAVKRNDAGGSVDNYISSVSANTHYIMIRINSEIDTVAKLKAFLQENPIKVQYELTEEQTENFTEEQKEAWEEWKKARTYKNITHISSEDETPANLRIQYYKEG